MRTLVTGATGHIGRHLLEVVPGPRVLTRDPAGAARRLGAVEALAWDPGQPPPAEAFRGVDVVYHLAGEPVADGRWTGEKKRRIRESRVGSTRNLVLGIERLTERPQVLVCASAVGYYGDRGDEELTEASPPGSGFFPDVVLAWEAAAAPAVDAGASVALARTGLVLATDGPLARMLTLARLGLGGPIGGGRAFWSWITLPDEVGAWLHLLDHPQVTGPVNLVSPSPVRQRDIAAALGRALHRPAVLPAPSFGVRLVVGEFADEILASKRIVGDVLADSGYTCVHADLDSAVRWLVA